MRLILLVLLFIIIVPLFPCLSAASAQSTESGSGDEPIVKELQEEIDTDPDFYRFYNRFTAGSSTLPFWLYSNSHGLSLPGSSFNTISGFYAETRLLSNSSNVDIRVGGELVNRFSDLENTFHFQQLYGNVQYRKLRIRAGRFYRMNDFDSALEGITTGFLVESHNATPHLRVSLETDGFIAVPKFNDRLYIRFRYSDGILEENRTMSSPYIHQKSLQLRTAFGGLSIQFGVFHSVIWAGTDEERGQLPRSFNDYLRVVFSRPAAEDSDATTSEMMNRLGNSIGVYEAGFVYHASRFRIVGYRHLFLEDEFSVEFQSPWDGIWGLGFIRNDDSSPIRAIIYEHMNSIRQESRKGLAQGRANFYNHGIYRNGWSYRNRVMGNPLFTYDPEENRVFNNVIVSHHLGVAGNFSSRFSYRSLLTYSRNYGVCRDQIISGSCNIKPGDPVPEDLQFRSRSELREDRLSGLIEVNYLLMPDQNLYLHASLAGDTGDFFGRRVGFMTGISIVR